MMELLESYREGFHQEDKISDISSPKLSSLSLDNLRAGNTAVLVFFVQNMPRRVSRPNDTFSLSSITLNLEKKCTMFSRTENSLFKKGFHPIVSEAILGRGNKCLAVTRMGQVELTGWQNFWPRVRWSLLHERESAPPSISKPALVLLPLLIVCVQLFLGYRADRRDPDPNILFSLT